MPNYQIYTVENDGITLQPTRSVEAADDYAALSEAQKLFEGQAVEIWNGKKIVVRLTPSEDVAGPGK